MGNIHLYFTISYRKNKPKANFRLLCMPKQAMQCYDISTITNFRQYMACTRKSVTVKYITSNVGGKVPPADHPNPIPQSTVTPLQVSFQY